VVARGWTQPGGRPHAEAVALAQAGGAARGATVFVTLEPCAHQGVTPPCADALVAAGVVRVVGAIEDPDPRVNGKGFQCLRDAGVNVESGLLAGEAAELNCGFITRVREGRPFVTLKIAQSLDGKVATASGESKWITGHAARRFGHLLRAQHDAILIGIGTALADDPELTCRIAGLEDRSPLRVVLDSHARLPKESKLAQSARLVPVLQFVSRPDTPPELAELGVETVGSAHDETGRIDMGAMLAELAKRGVTRLLVEGGPTAQTAFLERGLADRIELFTSPMVLGAAARDSAASLRASSLEAVPRFRRIARRALGADLLESLVRKA
jgi:diaminohydroxyphosphoribosylaminopyrimidine deaminase/5-amino-6-(5-phosphoribosylamino)uracil reductase